MRVNGSGVPLERIAPDIVQKLLSRADSAGVAHEILQEAEFRSRGGPTSFPSEITLWASGSRRMPVPFHRAVFGTLPAAEYGADAEHELPHAEGLTT